MPSTGYGSDPKVLGVWEGSESVGIGEATSVDYKPRGTKSVPEVHESEKISGTAFLAILRGFLRFTLTTMS